MNDHVPLDPPPQQVAEAVRRALAEDIGPLGDITSALLAQGAQARMALVSRQHGVLAGTCCAREAFRQVDPSLRVEPRLDDGSALTPGALIADVEGSLRSLLAAERTALNFMCHLSGVASLTRRFVDAVSLANPSTKVFDTRKTTPGLRSLEKAAVRAGGGWNHRSSLSEAVLVKDNHLVSLSITDAVKRAREAWEGRTVEIECDRLEQVLEAVEAGADIVMLDNMSPEQVALCVSAARSSSAGSAVLLEVSGGVTLESAPQFAAAGVDRVSVGALTHSAPVVDIGLDDRGR